MSRSRPGLPSTLRARSPYSVPPESARPEGRVSPHAGPPDAKSGERFLEQYYRHGQRNTPFGPAQPASFGLAPGVGIYVPPHRPHLVKSRSELTISLSVTWRPRDLRREGRVYAFNARRRDHGRHPRPVGASPLLDRAKSTYEGVCSRVRRAFRHQRAAGYG